MGGFAVKFTMTAKEYRLELARGIISDFTLEKIKEAKKSIGCDIPQTGDFCE